MEVLSAKSDFDFNTARSPPYSYQTAPPSPTGFSSSFFSAPTSPNRISDFYRDFDPGKEDFAFDSPLVSQRPSLSADELFDRGKIRPLAQIDEHKTPLLSPKLARSPVSKGKMMISNVFSSNKNKDENRGRDRENNDLSKNPSRRATRSLSPYRVLWEEEEEEKKTAQSPALAPKCSSRRWRLRDFLLFRSASEGRAADYKNPLRKHVGLFRRSEEVKGDNLRSDEDGTRRRGMSAHELHYTANRAAAEESKKRTFLPYKQGILGG